LTSIIFRLENLKDGINEFGGICIVLASFVSSNIVPHGAQ